MNNLHLLTVLMFLTNTTERRRLNNKKSLNILVRRENIMAIKLTIFLRQYRNYLTCFPATSNFYSFWMLNIELLAGEDAAWYIPYSVYL